MSRHDPQVRLQHMLEYAREAVNLLHGKSRADLDSERALGLATLRCLEVIGEAATQIPKEIRTQNPNVPWQAIIGTRNRLIHGYDMVDYDIIWSTVTQDLPALIAELEKIVPDGGSK